MRPTSLNRWVVALCATAGLLRGTQLAADPPTPGDVKVSVVAILASETSDKIDLRLKDVAAEIQKIHPQLKGFRIAKMTCKSVPVRGAESFELVADQSAAITVMRSADQKNRVQLKVTPPTLGEITYTTTCGKFFPIVTRYQTPNHESLIIAIRVQPCNGKKK
jgi:hypothetical protein